MYYNIIQKSLYKTNDKILERQEIFKMNFFIIVIFFMISGILTFLLGLKTKNQHMITSGGVIVLFLLLICINIYLPEI